MTFADKKSSAYVGVSFSRQKKKWTLQVRREKIQRICQSELEAAMLYNAVAAKIWPGCRRNPTPLQVLNNAHYCVGGERVIQLGRNIHARVDQDAGKWNYWTLVGLGWDHRGGVVQRGIYLPETKSFQFQTMHELVFGGPCRHVNGNALDNRRENLAAAAPVTMTMEEQEAAELAQQRAAEAAEGLTGSQEGSAEVIDPFSPEAFDLLSPEKGPSL